MSIENPTKTSALNSLDKISSALDSKRFKEDIDDHISLIRNYINNIAKQRQEKRDLELKKFILK